MNPCGEKKPEQDLDQTHSMLLSKPIAAYSGMDDVEGRPDDERAWIEQVRRGNREVFEALFRVYYADLVAFAQSQVQERKIAEDLVQDLFFDIWHQGPDWHPRGALRPYLYGATRKKCLMYFRRQRTRGQWNVEADVDDRPGGESPEETFRYNELRRAAQEAVEALPERRRLIFILSRHQGLTYAEIAEVLDLSIHTVRNQMAHALQFLRERLAPYLFTLL